MSKIDQSYNWDDVAQIEENQYNLMPDGTVVDFTVKDIEKTRNQKLNCPQMSITLICTSETCGSTVVNERISLHSKAQYFINAFFAAIGLAGENKSFAKLVEEAIGRKGRARLKQESWLSKTETDKDGKPIECFTNKVDKYLKCDAPQAPEQSAKTDSDDIDDNPF